MRNVEVVEQLLATVSRNDVDAAIALTDPAVEFVDVLAPVEHTVRDVKGADGMRAWFAGLHGEGVESVSAEPFDLQDLGDGRVLGGVQVSQERPGDSFSTTIYILWEVADGRIVRIDSFLDRDLALTAAGVDEAGGLVRRWVEGVVSAKLVERQAVRLRSAEHDGAEFSVRDPELWKQIEVGAMGMAETDRGELVGWRPLRPPAA